ncbi:MAG: hypothetical protein JF609_02270 [Verrucomicrobia bacterium]|nr:hypothetical protein [Verrucomicrobiota bacterium]
MDYTPILLIAAMPFVVALQVYFLVRKMSEPENMLKPVGPRGLGSTGEDAIARQQAWLDANGLQRLTSFEFGIIRAVVFQQRGTQRFFTFHVHQQKVSHEAESRFDEVTHLETSNSGNSGMFPARPGVYKQSFPGLTPEQLWQRHLEGEAYLMQKFSLGWRPLNLPYEQVVIS